MSPLAVPRSRGRVKFVDVAADSIFDIEEKAEESITEETKVTLDEPTGGTAIEEPVFLKSITLKTANHGETAKLLHPLIITNKNKNATAPSFVGHDEVKEHFATHASYGTPGDEILTTGNGDLGPRTSTGNTTVDGPVEETTAAPFVTPILVILDARIVTDEENLKVHDNPSNDSIADSTFRPEENHLTKIGRDNIVATGPLTGGRELSVTGPVYVDKPGHAGVTVFVFGPAFV